MTTHSVVATLIGSVPVFRRLRVLAAFFMVPVVLFVNPSQAAAASWQALTFDVPSSILGDDVPALIDSIDCQFSMRHNGGYSLSIGPGRCVGGPDVSAGFAQPGEANSGYVISVSGITDTSIPCTGSMTSTLGPHSSNGTLQVAGSITSSEMGVNQPDCTIQEVCLKLGTKGQELCEPYVLAPDDVEEPVVSACPGGSIVLWTEFKTFPHPTEPSRVIDKVLLHWTIAGAPAISTMDWAVAHRIGTTGGSAGVYNLDETKMGEAVILGEKQRLSSTTPWSAEVYVQAYGYAPGGWNAPVHDIRAASLPSVPPTAANMTYFGVTDAVHCRFYFGRQLHTWAGTELDTPAGDGQPIVEEPPPDEEEPPVIEDPPPVVDDDTDLGWLAKIWAVLRSIAGGITSGFKAVVSAITGLGSTIADAVAEMFDGLFLPPDDYMETKWNGVESQWSATLPAKYVDQVGDFSPGEVNGCGGLPLNFDLPGEVTISENLGAACSGRMAQTAEVVKVALSAVLAVGAVLGSLRALGSGFGWNPGIGRGGAS